MKIDVGKLIPTKENRFSEEVSLDAEKFTLYTPLLEVKKLFVNVSAHRYEDFIDVNLSIKADVVLQCSYSLKPFSSTLNDNDEIHFSSYPEDEGDMQIYKGNFIDLDPYIYNLLSASVPTCPVAPGAKLPSSGKDFRVMNEDDFKKEKENSYDPRFDKLKDLDL